MVIREVGKKISVHFYHWERETLSRDQKIKHISCKYFLQAQDTCARVTFLNKVEGLRSATL